MNDSRRAIEYKMYPESIQIQEIETIRLLHQKLYNAALQERIDAYRKNGKSISYFDQAKSLTEIRSFDSDYKKLNTQSSQLTLKRLDRAYKSFFRRVKKGEEPGFPRFKSANRFPGFGFASYGNGFKFTPGPNWENGILHLSGVGDIKVRGKARTSGKPVACSITKKADGWYLTLFLACDPYREKGTEECGMDWGVNTFLTMAYEDHDGVSFDEIQNERFLKSGKDDLIEAQRDLSKALRGKKSKNASKKRKLYAKRARKIANQRKNFLHQVTANLVKTHSLIVSEKLAVVKMTKSKKGNKQKTGLNRGILDTSPATLLKFIEYKAEEAGTEFILLDTKKLKPSQTCPDCNDQKKKGLNERRHVCDCGCDLGRDEASSLYMLREGRRQRYGTDRGMEIPETETSYEGSALARLSSG